MKIKKVYLKVRKSKVHNDMWECVLHISYMDGRRTAVTLCETDSEKSAYEIISRY